MKNVILRNGNKANNNPFNNYFVGDAIAKRQGIILYDIMKNYMENIKEVINNNVNNVREVVKTGINHNMLFMALREKATGKVVVFVYQFSIDGNIIKVRIKNSERDDMSNFNIPKKIQKLNPVFVD